MSTRLKGSLDLLQVGFDVLGFFMATCMLVVLANATYVWLQEPKRLAMEDWRAPKGSPDRYRIILPQPKRVTPEEEHLWMPSLSDPEMPMNISLGILTSGIATNASIWIHGKSFQSGGAAAWELVRAAWRLWLVGTTTLILTTLLRRYRSGLKAIAPVPSREVISTPEIS